MTRRGPGDQRCRGRRRAPGNLEEALHDGEVRGHDRVPLGRAAGGVPDDPMGAPRHSGPPKSDTAGLMSPNP